MSRRLLVAEDDPSIALALRDDLELDGYEVTVVSDGREAVRLTSQESFDLLILDLMLPGKNGYDVCREIRRFDDGLPILMLSARSQDVEKVMGLELGADDYVTKPFSPLELRARIKTLLRRRSGGRTRTVGRVTIDLDRYQATCDDRSLDLTPIELRLLVALANADGRALSRSDLLDSVWGQGVVVSDRTVDSHMANLRAKLDGTGVQVESVRGVGYRMRD